MKTTLAILVVLAAATSCLSAAGISRRSLSVVDMNTPPFPPALLHRGITSGEADVIVSIAPDGKVADWLVIAYTDPQFERTVDGMLRTMTFALPEAGTSAPGRAGPVRVTLRFLFEAHGVVISQTINDTVSSMVRRMTGIRRIDKMGTIRDLDRSLVAHHTVQPYNPLADTGPAASAGPAKVTLEFLVDENGRVRMPVLHEGEDPALANAAAAALLAWQFEPPTRQGQPVIVSARQEFIFNPAR